jgi:proliferating cell nuclear antigen
MATFDPSNYVFIGQTIQISSIRTLVNALKEILTRTNIYITPACMEICNMDKSNHIIAHVKLEAENFEHYYCKKDKIVVGANLIQLYKLVNMLEADDTLTMLIHKNDYCDGIVTHLTLQFDNGEIKQCTTHRLKLIDVDQEEIEIPEVTYCSIITLPSPDFQKIIRNFDKLTNKIEIKSVGDDIIFNIEGAFVSSQVVRSQSNNSMSIKEKPEPGKIIQGEFSLRNLGYATKCTNLSDFVEIYLENDLPMIIEYKVGTLGIIQLCCVPLPPSSSS